MNQEILYTFVKNSKLLLHPRRSTRPPRKSPDYVHPALAAVKLMCSHFLFELDNVKHGLTGMEESQRVVYMATNSAPIYTGPTLTDLNMQWILHCMNFFRHHMMSKDVGTLYEVLKDLSAYQIPSAWQDPLRSGTTPLGKHWKGTYAFLDHAEIGRLRRLSPEQLGDDFFPDKNVDEGKIQVCRSHVIFQFMLTHVVSSARFCRRPTQALAPTVRATPAVLEKRATTSEGSRSD
jgi:hypothetical protein